MKAVTYAEIDLPKCRLTYGILPCGARKVGDNLGTGYKEYFNGTDAGWTGSNVTLTPALGGLEVLATGADPQVRKGSLSIVGADNHFVTIEVTRLTAGATWDGRVLYTTAGHAESASFYKQIAATDVFTIGDRVMITLDMSALTVGGTDWTSSTITGLRLDLDATGTGSWKLNSVQVGPLADDTTATGTEKCYNTLKTCQDLEHYDVDDRPLALGTKIESFKSSPALSTFDVTTRALGAVAADGETRRWLAHLSFYRAAGAVTLTSATIGGIACTIRGQTQSGTVTTAIIESDEDPDGTSGTLHIVASAAVAEFGMVSYRLINAEFVAATSNTTVPSPTASVDLLQDYWALAGVTSYQLSTTTWSGLTENTDDSNGSFHFSGADVQHLTIPDDLAHAITATQAYPVVSAPTYVSPILPQTGVGATLTAAGLAVGDIVVAFAEIDPTDNAPATPAGWAALGNVTGSTTTKLYAFWIRLAATSFSASFTGPADHIHLRGVVIRGAAASGTPIIMASGSAAAATSATVPSVTTTVNNVIVIDAVSQGVDSAAANFSAWTNTNLTSYAEIDDLGTVSGNGGGIGIAAGVKATAGATGTSTVTSAANTAMAYMKIAIQPLDTALSKASMEVARYAWSPSEQGTIQTIRFGMDTGFNNKDIDSINCISDYSHNPTVISLGEDLGTREGITFNMFDVPHPDTGGFDKYWFERGYDPYTQGTFWPRLLARQPYFGGKALRWYEGDADQELSEMVVRHFLIENISGPDARGGVTVVGKDPLKMADSDRAVAPFLSLGYLLNDITDVATSATLTPTGIGNENYATSGYAAIAGNELVTFTRSGDALTIVREQMGTPKSAHPQQDHFQTALFYDAMDAADIIYDLLVTYAGVNPAWINLDDWHEETGAYLRRNYTKIIGEPTPVRKLIIELIQQAGLAIWWDSANQTIRLIVLREIPADATVIDATVRLENAPTPRYQPEKRVSQVIVHFAIKDPLKSVSDPNNFRQRAFVLSAESERNYGTSAIKNIYASWIAPFARTTAIRVGDLNIGRFGDAPRRFTFDLPRGGIIIPVTGGAYRITARNLQAFNGSLINVPVQLTSVRVERDRYSCEAEEMAFISYNAEDLVNRVITISGTNYNLNLKEIHDDIYPPLDVGNTIKFVFDETSKTGSNDPLIPAVRTGTGWGSFAPHIEVRGKIQGKGGSGGKGANDGGSSSSGGKNGTPGGTALKVESDITLTDTTGKLWGGGGGGAGGSCADFDDHRGGGGGGGGGLVGGNGGLGPGNGEEGKIGTETTGGAGGRSYTSSTFWTGPSLQSGQRGGNGGAPGVAGNNDVGSYDVPGGSPGAAGNSIDGIADVTTIGTVGSRLGPQV